MTRTETTSTVLLKHHLKALRLPTILASLSVTFRSARIPRLSQEVAKGGESSFASLSVHVCGFSSSAYLSP